MTQDKGSTQSRSHGQLRKQKADALQRKQQNDAEINAYVYATFVGTNSGVKVLNFLKNTTLNARLPDGADDKLVRELRGQQNLVLDIMRRIEKHGGTDS